MATKTLKKKATKKVAKTTKKASAVARKPSNKIIASGKDSPAKRHAKSEKYYSTKELALLEKVTLRTVYDWIEAGKIKAIKSEKPVDDFDANEWMIPKKTYKRPQGYKKK